MKVLKIIGIVVGSILLIGIVLAFIAPREIAMERTTTIDAPASVIFPMVKYFEKRKEWTHWTRIDPNMDSGLTGADGEVGTEYYWVSDHDSVGEGRQTLTSIKENEAVTSHIQFIKPFQSEADSYMRLTENGNSTLVAWGFRGDMPIPFNILGLFMNITEGVGKDYDRGLANLKKLAEAAPGNNFRGYVISPIEFQGAEYAIVRGEVAYEELAPFMENGFNQLMGQMQRQQIEPAGYPCALYFDTQTESGNMALATAMPVQSGASIEEYEIYTISPHKALKMEVKGDYEKLPEAYQAIAEYMAAHSMTQADLPILEEYVTDPTAEPDTSQWLTQVYYFVE